jgi:Sulfatase
MARFPEGPPLHHLITGALSRLRLLYGPLMRWYYPALAWSAFVILAGLLLGIRIVKASGLAKMVEFKDIPILYFTVSHYGAFYWAGIGIGLLCAGIAGWWWWRGRSEWPRLLLFLGTLTSTGLLALTGRYASLEPLVTVAPGFWDWVGIAILGLTPLAYTWALSEHAEELGPEPTSDPCHPASVLGLSVVYLLCVTSVFAHSVLDHLRMWDPEWNGGYRYARFLAEGELAWTNMVLWSTSMLFASVAAMVACVWVLVSRLVLPRSHHGAGYADIRRQSKLAAAVLTFSAVGPWMTRLSPEISAEQCWHLPIGYLACMFSILTPLVFLSALLLKRDFEPPQPPQIGARAFQLNRSEVSFLAFVLFPVYPFLRILRPRSPLRAYLFTGVLALTVLTGATWAAFEAADLWTFEDWRGMMKVAQFPYTRVFLSMMVAAGVLVVGQRLLGWWQAREQASPSFLPGAPRSRGRLPRRIAVATTGILTLTCLTIASWPFWGWGQVPKNALARAAEFNDRHEFERRFLHWVLDFDRDGYAGLLQGGDPDDFDASVQGGGLPPLELEVLPPDEWEVVDAERAAECPNLLVLMLEGVTPRAISAYGMRELDGRVATPAIDALASEGTLFTKAWCAYPSTWDGWFMTLSGRLLRVYEMDASQPFFDRYTRYNNFYRIMNEVGTQRWCQPNSNPYPDLFVPAENRLVNWEDDFDSRLTSEDQSDELTRGDKRNDRLLRFLDSVEEGERFFASEHLGDTHFPWRRVSSWRARELGYPGGMGFAEQDAYVDGEFIPRLARYYQQITRMDTQVRDIVAKLKERGLYENTIIAIVSDHGCQWYEHEHGYYVSHIYEQSLRIPMIIRVPGAAEGVVCDVPVVQADVVPTIAELAGVRLTNNEDRPLFGRSMVPLINGEPVTPEVDRRFREREVLLTTHYDTFGLIKDFKTKLIYDRPTGTSLLFDLEDDPEEMINLADVYPELLLDMQERLRLATIRHMNYLGGLERCDEHKALHEARQ